MAKKSPTPIDMKDPWLEIPIGTWEKFQQTIDELASYRYVFRGQSCAKWGLSTSLERTFDQSNEIIRRATGKERTFARREHELHLLKAFQKNAHLLNRGRLPEPKEELEWFAIMQHYGAPTRLLDVTFSPYVALFFALESGVEDSSLFAIDHMALKEDNDMTLAEPTHAGAAKLIFKSRKSYITLFNPELGNERQQLQQALFLVPSQLNRPIESLLKDYQDFADGEFCIKYVIPAALRMSGLAWLKRMNVTSATLFPGIDGYARSLTFQPLERMQHQKMPD